MWHRGWRQEIWAAIEQEWDLLIIGGGITGAGILREATRLGLRALLVEQHDFGWGTSSRSSKLVHGGLRYLKDGKVMLTRASVHERQQLLAEAPGLVEPLGFLLASYRGDSPGRLVYEAGLTVYDLLALQWSHRYYSAQDFRMLAGSIAPEGLKGGFRYGDAQTDDARLVLRVIREAVADGATALNYVGAESVVRDETQRVVGAQLRDVESGQTAVATARVVINATGAWADRLRQQVGEDAKIRPLRGSHLIFPAWRLPVAQAVSFLHPQDSRPVFLLPWEGVTLVGTTDVDHQQALEQEPHISPEETAYLMAAVQARYPSLGLTLDDVISTFAGVRPVIGSGKLNPSEESRDHVVWQEAGLLTVTGGKLTTFRLIALDVLKAIHDALPDMKAIEDSHPILDPVQIPSAADGLDEKVRRRLFGRYGVEASDLLAAAQPGELEAIPGTSILWAELRWAARAEGVVHLDDLLLRRVRLGLLLRDGGAGLLPRLRAICQPELGWEDTRWSQELANYLDLWRRCYSLPDRTSIPDWYQALEEARRARAERIALQKTRRRRRRRATLLTFLSTLALILSLLFIRDKTAPGA